jgi:hypothetical protein
MSLGASIFLVASFCELALALAVLSGRRFSVAPALPAREPSMLEAA